MAVTLRARTDADADVLFTLAAELDTWEERGPLPPTPLSRQQYDVHRVTSAEDTASFVVDLDGVAVGTAGLFHIDRFAGHAEAGISLVASARGQGVGTTAIRLLVDFAFARQNLRRVHLQAIASNVAALEAYEKAGFVVEGRLREHAWVRGRYEDIVLMSVLRGRRSDIE